LRERPGMSTKAVHAGFRCDPTTGASVLPIYQSASFCFRDLESARALFQMEERGFIYSRISNPTVEALEERVAALEGGSAACAFASGQAALTALALALCSPGSHVVSSSRVYGGSYELFSVVLSRLGIDFSFVDPHDLGGLREAIREETAFVFVETIGNPTLDVPDLEGWARIAHERGVPLVVDNTFASPALCRPLEHGADVVLHSATKYMCGLGSSIGGVIVEGGNFDWKSSRFPNLSRPDPIHGYVYADRFGDKALSTWLRSYALMLLGGCMSPFNAFLIWQGLFTLPLRMRKHSENAMGVAEFLSSHPMVEWVNYPLLPGSRSHPNASRYLPEGASGMVSFGVRGGLREGALFLQSLSLFKHLANVGDSCSLAVHPASTTHSALSPEERARAGIPDNMIRLSVGIEDLEDIIYDLERALEEVRRS